MLPGPPTGVVIFRRILRKTYFVIQKLSLTLHWMSLNNLLKKNLVLKALVLSLLLLCNAADTFAQSGKITGVVLDETQTPMPGVNVVIVGTTRGTSTDADGRYFLLNMQPGTYQLRVTMVGYQAIVKENVIVNINRTSTVNFDLAPATIEGEEILITATRPDVEVDQTATLEIVRPDEIAGTPGLTDLSDVLNLQAEVSDGHFRGGRSNEELYMLAGMGIVNPLNSSRSFTPILSAVEEIEVITSGFSAEYGNAMSGVINISMKEGQREWRGGFETRLRLPGYKHWGGSVFNPENNPYIQELDNLAAWMEPDPNADDQEQQRWEGAIGRGFGSAVDDPEAGAQIVYDLWRQAHQGIGQDYDNRFDRLVDFHVGGPLADNITFFGAAQFNDEWGVLPTPVPDQSRQVMGNIAYEAGPGMKLKLSSSYANGFAQEFSSSFAGFYRWVFDRVIGANKVRDQALQLGAQWTHVVNDRTFYEINAGVLRSRTEEGVDALAASDSTFVDDVYDRSLWERIVWPDGFRTGVMDDDFFDEKSNTYSLVASVTSQINQFHEVKAGFQGNVYAVDVDNRINHSSRSSAQQEFYEADPIEGALYVQDKMEFEGMIANVGLRLDVYNPRISFYTNQFSPFEDPDNPGFINEESALTSDTETVLRIQPRLGFSFPVSTSVVFHLNYGNYLKRPSLEYLIGRRTTLFNSNLGSVEARRIGNPRLKPEETKSYDVGLVVGLGDGFTLDASGYYKDVKNLVERVIYRDQNGQYESMINRDYADVRGFNLRLNKRRGVLAGSVRYNFQVVTGKSSNPFDNERTIAEDGIETNIPDPRDIFLDYDRRHNLVLTFGLNTNNQFGPKILGGYPLGKWHINVLHSSRSGRPFTPFASNDINSARTPWEHNTDLNISRDISLPRQVNATLFLEVFNLFNTKVFDYNRVFQDPENRQKWEQDRDGIDFFQNDSGYITNQSIRIYNNMPRSFSVGVVFDM